MSCTVLLCIPVLLFSEPIVLTGSMFPNLLGKPLADIRIIDHAGKAIPFQIDEVTPDGEYVCPMGSEPNSGNNKLDAQDEIVFLQDDADEIPVSVEESDVGESFSIQADGQKRYAAIVDNPNIALSPVRYMQYNAKTESFTTPSYAVTFAHDRFSFTSASVKDNTSNTYVHLTNELHIKIYMRILWGLLPISYSEDNLICLVKRYKIGPIRIIRRGDFHLNLGMGLKASHASVNQICYPDMVSVPVYVHLPVRLKSIANEAYIEMAPVIRQEGRGFVFVGDKRMKMTLGSNPNADSLLYITPNHRLITVTNGTIGYGWLLDATMQEQYLGGSGYMYHALPSSRGLAYCGFRLSVRDLPKGMYMITNWVLFSNRGRAEATLENAGSRITNRAVIMVGDKRTFFFNQLTHVK